MGKGNINPEHPWRKRFGAMKKKKAEQAMQLDRLMQGKPKAVELPQEEATKKIDEFLQGKKRDL